MSQRLHAVAQAAAAESPHKVKSPGDIGGAMRDLNLCISLHLSISLSLSLPLSVLFYSLLISIVFLCLLHCSLLFFHILSLSCVFFASGVDRGRQLGFYIRTLGECQVHQPRNSDAKCFALLGFKGTLNSGTGILHFFQRRS